VLTHLPGHANNAADFLSWHPDFKEGVKFMNNDITVLLDNLFLAHIFLEEGDDEG